jgi:exopolysaccharide biosynthesis polyprenyl glycosylphosphotransferase
LPFSFIFLYSIIIFYIAGLYGEYNNRVQSTLSSRIIKSQIANAILAIILFYFIPTFEISPKMTLLVYIIISSVILIIWRKSIFTFLGSRTKNHALIIGSGEETLELCAEMNKNPHSPFKCVEIIANTSSSIQKFQNNLVEKIKKNGISYIVLDMEDPCLKPLLPELYKIIFKDVHCINIYRLYEEMFGRIPLSCIEYKWILENVSPSSPHLYDILKRATDIILSLVLSLITLILWPFVALSLKIQDGGPVFVTQDRVGKNGQNFKVYKFRSMNRSDNGKWLVEADNNNRVTTVGRFLRKSRIDELPQVWSVLKGDLSLIGPRWDIKNLGDRLAKEIPYYTVRTVIKPGLSGWAQINQEKPPQSIEETKIRLSYDLYYIKNRSLGLDIRIALKTIRTLLSLVGM